MQLASISLDDKYTQDKGRVLISGVQALVRLPLMQRQRDLEAGLNTAGFISGYRGSPLGGYDLNLWRARPFLERAHIHFQPGVNEDLAATAVWGSQQLAQVPDPKYDGVFAIWYGKGPGVDRSGDPFKHGNLAGTHPHGGVLLMCGDDHAGKSSTTAHQSELSLAAHGIPVLNPANVQDYLDLGLYGWALSRFSGLWVGFICVNETVESTATVSVDPDRNPIVVPTDIEPPPGGVHALQPRFNPQRDDVLLMRHKLPLAQAFARANAIDRVVFGGEAILGIVAAGKAFQDVMQALQQLGIDEQRARHLGVSVYKVGMVWPLEPDGLRVFASGLRELLFVEEKRPLMEDQAARILYNRPEGQRPFITGKRDQHGEMLLPSDEQLDPSTIAQVIAARLGSLGAGDEQLTARRARIEKSVRNAAEAAGGTVIRTPYFCSGCPHNVSTKVPDGSMALSGIGCHTMAIFMQRHTLAPTQMGGEGLNWTGLAPFTNTRHVFQNLGDGTYFHSGLLAIRASIDAGVNLTYKILYNDAVAMTGGQPVEGQLGVADIARQVAAEGVARIALVSDDPGKYDSLRDLPEGLRIAHRDDLEGIQIEYRGIAGTTVIIYDQTCAAEKRRRRKRGLYPDPEQRVFINSSVCEGCGDCSAKSNCVSIQPLETEFGRKRRIDQSSCNKDFSCINGFCPSFVTVLGGRLRRPPAKLVEPGLFADLPEPETPSLSSSFAVLVAGVGGTGVVTIGAVLGMAAHLEGKTVSVFDMTGLAQKGGTVHSHLKIAPGSRSIAAQKIGLGEADLLLGCDLVVAASPETLSWLNPGGRAIVNTHLLPTAAFQLDPDVDYQPDTMRRVLADVIGDSAINWMDATQLALSLCGDVIGANLFMVGFAAQSGLIPLGIEAIERAIELNGVAVDFNQTALQLGRLAAHDPARIDGLINASAAGLGGVGAYAEDDRAHSLEQAIALRESFLSDYQNDALAQRYRKLVERVQAAEQDRAPGTRGLTEAVARYYFKLLAYKDEYEVARLYTRPQFRAQLDAQFEGDYKLKFHLAPPLIAKRDPVSGEARKRTFGGWMLIAFKLLAAMRGLRGTRLDVFALSAERQLERRLIHDYELLVDELLSCLTRSNHDLQIELASLPEQIRGFGHVKRAHLARVDEQRVELLRQLRDPRVTATAA